MRSGMTSRPRWTTQTVPDTPLARPNSAHARLRRWSMSWPWAVAAGGQVTGPERAWSAGGIDSGQQRDACQGGGQADEGGNQLAPAVGQGLPEHGKSEHDAGK